MTQCFRVNKNEKQIGDAVLKALMEESGFTEKTFTEALSTTCRTLPRQISQSGGADWADAVSMVIIAAATVAMFMGVSAATAYGVATLWPMCSPSEAIWATGKTYLSSYIFGQETANVCVENAKVHISGFSSVIHWTTTIISSLGVMKAKAKIAKWLRSLFRSKEEFYDNFDKLGDMTPPMAAAGGGRSHSRRGSHSSRRKSSKRSPSRRSRGRRSRKRNTKRRSRKRSSKRRSRKRNTKRRSRGRRSSRHKSSKRSRSRSRRFA